MSGPAVKGYQPPDTDNSDLPGKLAVRQAALEAAGPGARVLDCYAGEGHMYGAIWHRAEQYLGLEQRFARAPGHANGEAWKGDNRVLITRAMERAPWNIVDIDPYGSPWEMFRRVVRLSRQDRLAVTITCGLCRAMRSPNPIHWLCDLLGLHDLKQTPGLWLWYDDVIRWTIAHCLRDTGFAVTRARCLQSTGSPDMRYWLLELERRPAILNLVGGNP